MGTGIALEESEEEHERTKSIQLSTYIITIILPRGLPNKSPIQQTSQIR